MNIKAALKSAPVIGPVISRLRAPRFVGSSADYWEDRYASGGTSGAGSYNRLAHFKAEFLNGFVEQHGIESVIELGSGDGSQVALANYPLYFGVDVSATAVDRCNEMYVGERNRAFMSKVPDGFTADLSLSLDVIYHLVEDRVFDAYMRQLFDVAKQWVIMYSSNKDEAMAAHVRHRKFTRWVEKNRSDFALVETVPNRYPYDPGDPDNTSFADFYVYRKV